MDVKITFFFVEMLPGRLVCRVTTRLENLEYLEMSWNSKNRQICHGNVMEFQENR